MKTTARASDIAQGTQPMPMPPTDVVPRWFCMWHRPARRKIERLVAVAKEAGVAYSRSDRAFQVFNAPRDVVDRLVAITDI